MTEKYMIYEYSKNIHKRGFLFGTSEISISENKTPFKLGLHYNLDIECYAKDEKSYKYFKCDNLMFRIDPNYILRKKLAIICKDG
jgi:hypothetical protein